MKIIKKIKNLTEKMARTAAKLFAPKQESHYIKLLTKRLPEELICKTVTIEYVVYEKCEGAYIEDGKPQLFGYVGYRNIFKLVPGTEVVIVTDKKGFFAFIKRDKATESLYREE